MRRGMCYVLCRSCQVVAHCCLQHNKGCVQAWVALAVAHERQGRKEVLIGVCRAGWLLENPMCSGRP